MACFPTKDGGLSALEPSTALWSGPALRSILLVKDYIAGLLGVSTGQALGA